MRDTIRQVSSTEEVSAANQQQQQQQQQQSQYYPGINSRAELMDANMLAAGSSAIRPPVPASVMHQQLREQQQREEYYQHVSHGPAFAVAGPGFAAAAAFASGNVQFTGQQQQSFHAAASFSQSHRSD